MSHCLCCQGNLLRHVRHSGIYWFCPNCRQEMPEGNPNVQQHLGGRHFAEAVRGYHPLTPLP